ncbi:Pumilio RNA-binding repeat [Venturia nashicola]|uniref:Pumilio RNA-binding repeat n=1 Tax=Venturia nashicola TaxID=86259 RepID=A0A4Z1NY76_9PEZI|nr:Pumilio RNA-binding repeat [Venturia nashicola]TLD31954.1 Pumilio RNA-binding repeat [Venturia nashicola]
MARNQDDMMMRPAALPARYTNGTKQNGTGQNGASNEMGSNGMASNGTNPLAMSHDNAVSQNTMNGMSNKKGMNNMHGMNSINGINGMTSFGTGRPVLSDRSNPVMRSSDSVTGSRAPSSSSTWHSSPWTSTGATRENSRTRETSSLGGRTNIESANSYQALLGSSEVWIDPTASSQPPIRSVRTSPVRRDSSFSVQDPGSAPSTSQTVFGARPAYQRPTNGISGNQGQRNSDGAAHPFGHQTRLSDENLHDENSQSGGSSFLRRQPPTLPSPTDANNSRNSSFGPSRNGSRDLSLPPSRNGSDHQGAGMGRFGQPAAQFRPRNDWKYPFDRNDSQSGDLTGMLTQMNISNGQCGVNHGRSQSSAQSPQELYSQPLKSLANGHDDMTMASHNAVVGFQSDAENIFLNSLQQQQQSDLRSIQRAIYHSTSNDIPQNSYTSNVRAVPPYQNQQDQAQIAALNFQQQQQHQQMLMLQQHAAAGYRTLYAPHQPSRMNPQPPYQYPMMPMQPAILQGGPAHQHNSNDAMADSRISSPKLNEFKATHKDCANKSSARRWELKDIAGHVVEFSGDQHGSRFLQSRIESANSDEKEKLFQEILPEAVQLTKDLFGNWVIQKLFNHGDQAQKRALADKLKTKMYSLSTQMYACRVVQHALEHVLSDQQNELVQELEPWIEKLARHQHGNHVIQCSIQCLDSHWVQTVLDAVHPKIVSLAKDQFGCRVIQRLLENCVEPTKRRIFDELHPNTLIIITDQYGNYVAQNMMKFGGPDDRSKMIGLVKQHLLTFAKNKFASNVVEKCLSFGSIEQRRDLMEVLLHNPDYMCQLIQDQYGNYVIQQFLHLLEDLDYSRLVEEMKPQMAKAKTNSSGKQIAAVEKLMHKQTTNGKNDTPDGRALPTPSGPQIGSREN